MYLYVRSFADTRSQIKSDLRGVTKVVMNHLIKVWLYPNVQEQNHWKKEIAQALNDVPKVKGRNRYPDYRFLIQNTWNIYEDSLYDRVDVIISSMKEDPIPFDFEDLYQAMSDYFDWICYRLSEKGIINYSDIYDEIEKLRKTYFGLS